MADEEHLRILGEGVDRWNQWRKENPEIKPDLSEANLEGINFSGADFSRTDLVKANLREATLVAASLDNAHLTYADLSKAIFHKSNDSSKAILTRADFSEAELIQADLSKTFAYEADFTGANLDRANFSGAILVRANFDRAFLAKANLSNALMSSALLSGACLRGASLQSAILRLSELIETDFSGANLGGADLSLTQALDADFSKAILTGANIECWNINSRTKLNAVVFDYVYFKVNEQERRPSDRSKFFAPGDFAKLVQEGLETVDLIFSKGIDWKAFALSLEDLRVEYEGEYLSIGAIENKNGAFVVRLNVSPDADKEAIERRAQELYETQAALREANLRGKLKSRKWELARLGEELEKERKKSTWMEGIIQTMAEKENSKYDLRGSKFGGGFAAEGGMQLGGTFIDASSNQTLVEVAQEIQQIHDHLLQTQPSLAMDELELAKQLRAEIEKRPTLKERFIGALKSGGAEALKEAVDRSGFNILLEFARGWANPE